MQRLHDAGQHVEHPRAGRPAVDHGERSGSERSEREHRVVMAEQQHLGIATARPVDVRAGRAVDEHRRGPEVTLDHRRQRLGGRLQRSEIERRGLDFDEGAQIVEHRVEREGGRIEGGAHRTHRIGSERSMR